MYKHVEMDDVKKNIDGYKALDKDFVLNEQAEYCELIIGGNLSGYAEIQKEKEYYVINKIFISPNERYKCHGSKFIKFIDDITTKCGMSEVVAKIDESRIFLEKNGFQERNGVLVYSKILERKNRFANNSKVIIFSIIGNIVLAFTKITFGISGKSRVLLTDGLNSLSDVATSTGMLVGAYYSNAPADEDHPYGHEKIESVIANVLGIGMILLAFEMGRGSINLLIDYAKLGTHELPHVNTIWWAVLSAVVKWFMYYYKLKVGQKTSNASLIADAKDSRNDIFTSLGAVAGILLAIYVSPIFDIILSLPIAIIIMKEGISVIFENANLILDKQDQTLIKEIETYIYENTGIVNVHDMKMRTSGDKLFLTLHIRVPKDMTVVKAHEIADSLESSLVAEFEDIKEVLIHVDPEIN